MIGGCYLTLRHRKSQAIHLILNCIKNIWPAMEIEFDNPDDFYSKQANVLVFVYRNPRAKMAWDEFGWNDAYADEMISLHFDGDLLHIVYEPSNNSKKIISKIKEILKE